MLIIKTSVERILVIDCAGFIRSLLVAELLKADAAEVIIYDNFARREMKCVTDSLRDNRCRVYPFVRDIRDIDLLNEAMWAVDYVFQLTAMWLLHCKYFPRAAFQVYIEGTFNVLEPLSEIK